MIRGHYTHRGRKHELCINGHAGYAEYGKDIVCSGVSAIVYALLGWIEHHEDELTELEDVIVEDGQVYIACAGNDRVNTAFQVAVTGLVQIARQYPDCVEIEYPGSDR